MEILEILKREAEVSSLVYLYEEEGHWYAYEHSAILICKLLKGIVTIKQFIHDTYELLLEKVEILDITLLNGCFITSCSDTELVITYPGNSEQ